MTKKLSLALLVVVIALLITTPVLAAYYVDIDVTESNGTDYDMLPIITSMNVSYLAEHEFITDNGADVRIEDSQGNDLPFMLADEKVIFASDITGDLVNSFDLTTDNSLLDSFIVCTGDGGYVTTSDHANLELGDDFEIEWDGYIDTSVSGSLISKTDAFEVSSDGAGHITATIYGCADIEQEVYYDGIQLYSGSYVRAAHYIANVPAAHITQLSFSMQKSGSPTGTAYIRVRQSSDDAILGTIGTIDVSTLTGSYAWYDFTGSIYNPSTQGLRFTVEYSGGDVSNKIHVRYENSDVIDGYVQRYIASWSDATGWDLTTKIYFDDVSVTASVASGEHTIKVTGDGSDLKIYGDDSEEDSDTIIPVLNNANNWVLGGDAIPYFTYQHTTSGTLRITYAPDSIISGTTLPNEENPGTYDGTITWGANPAGISVSNSALQSVETYYFEEIDPESQDIAEFETAPMFTDVDLERLAHNPFHPLVEAMADGNQLTERLVWLGGAWILLIAAVVAVLIMSHANIVLTSGVGLGLSILFYSMGIFDYWVIILFGLGLLGAIIHERMPTY